MHSSWKLNWKEASLFQKAIDNLVLLLSNENYLRWPIFKSLETNWAWTESHKFQLKGIIIILKNFPKLLDSRDEQQKHITSHSKSQRHMRQDAQSYFFQMIYICMGNAFLTWYDLYFCWGHSLLPRFGPGGVWPSWIGRRILSMPDERYTLE